MKFRKMLFGGTLFLAAMFTVNSGLAAGAFKDAEPNKQSTLFSSTVVLAAEYEWDNIEPNFGMLVENPIIVENEGLLLGTSMLDFGVLVENPIIVENENLVLGSSDKDYNESNNALLLSLPQPQNWTLAAGQSRRSDDVHLVFMPGNRIEFRITSTVNSTVTIGLTNVMSGHFTPVAQNVPVGPNNPFQDFIRPTAPMNNVAFTVQNTSNGTRTFGVSSARTTGHPIW